MPKTEPFERHTQAYDEWFDNNSELYEAELKAVKEFISDNSLEGMEIGVGSGKFAAPLGIKIGVEPSEKMAERAKKLGIKVYSAVAENLPFSDNRFDFVLMVTTICFVDDVVKSFKEALRVLKGEGFIVVGFVDIESELGKEYEKKKDKSKFYKEATFFNAKEVLNLLKQAGFKNIETKQTLIPGELKTVIDGYGKGAFVVIKAVK
jgi:SAM-dependent methyltransferase